MEEHTVHAAGRMGSKVWVGGLASALVWAMVAGVGWTASPGAGSASEVAPTSAAGQAPSQAPATAPATGPSAPSAQSAKGAQSAPVVLTLQQAMAKALEVAPELRLAQLTIAEKEIALKEAEIGQMEGRPASELAAAQFDVEQAKQALADASEQVALRVEQQYYQVLRSSELLDIQRQNVERATKQFKVTEARYQAGLISRQDYLVAQDQQTALLDKFAQGQAQLELAKLQFKMLLGLDEAQEITLQDRFPFEVLPVDLKASLQEALQNRSDLQQAARTVSNAQKQVALSDNDYTPPVQLQKAKMALERAQIAADQARAQALVDVRQKYLALEQARMDVEESRRARERAADGLRIAEARYNNGMSPLLDLLNAQTQQAQAELDAVGSVWDYNLAKAQFLQAIGRRLIVQK